MIRFLQKIGQSLIIPIVVMPAAAILKRIGMLEFDSAFMSRLAEVFNAGGSAIFDNLPLLFAVGIAVGLSGGQGVAALSSVVGYLVFNNVVKTFEVLDSHDQVIVQLNTGVLGGILTGMITAFLYIKFKNIKLPQVLGYFSGKRFVPIITSLVMVLVGVAIGLIWSPIQEAIYTVGLWTLSLGGVGSFIYGMFNRLLIPTGLHHIINHIAWFQIGEYTDTSGNIVHGDLSRFFAQDPTAGMYMAGFFPIMMFGLPAAALAIVNTASAPKKKMIASVMITAGLTSFLTGITEPIEFVFMFSAPILYAIHAILTGSSMLLMHLLDIKMGFGFSAGFIDLLMNWKLATNPLMLLMFGGFYFMVYYFIFKTVIRVFDLKTPGREMNPLAVHTLRKPQYSHIEEKAADILSLVGGFANIKHIDACITRLRLTLNDDQLMNEEELTNMGVYGIIHLGKGNVHLVFGTDSELIKDAIIKKLPDEGANSINE